MGNSNVTFGVIIGTRGFFNPSLAADDREKLLGVLDRLGHRVVILNKDATPTGAVETRKDAQVCAKLFAEHREEIDGIIVSLPNFGDEIGIAESIRLSGCRVPVLVQAANDDPDKVDVASRRDSFCGKLSVCNNLYQYGIPFTDTALHTCDVDGEAFIADIDRFARICSVVRGLSTARIGLIGTRPAAFQTVRFSEKLLQASGITIVPIDLSVMLDRAEKMLKQSELLKKKIKEFRAYGTIPEAISDEQVGKQAAFTLAVDEWVEEEELDATAIQCWDTVEKLFGCATCLTMSLMGERGKPSACEADIAGAVSMLALRLASGEAPGLLDWNNNYADDPDKCVSTHCSNYPRSFMGNDIEISELDILGGTIGKSICFGAIKGRVASGDMTFFRISTDDTQGYIKGYVGAGEFTDDPFPMDGGIAVCKVDRLQFLMKTLCANGFEHHVAMVRGKWDDVVREAVSTYLGWEVYHHNSEPEVPML